MIRDVLDLRSLGDDRFDAMVPDYDYRSNLFGGQVAGQALRAATLTVSEDRAPHSFHCYFVRSGRQDVPLTMAAERVRDGRSFTVRGDEAVQEGEVILDLVASFHAQEHGPRPQQPLPDVRQPEDTPPDEWPSMSGDALETRIAFAHQQPAVPPFGTMLRFWTRSTETWPDEPGLAAAYAAYISDMRTGSGTMGTGERPN